MGAVFCIGPSTKTSNTYREILQKMQQCCPLKAVYAEILQEIQQIQRKVAQNTEIYANYATLYFIQ